MKFNVKIIATAFVLAGAMAIIPLTGKPGQGPGGPGAQGQGPCMQDMKRICPNAKTRQERRQCMKQNKSQFSQACQQRMQQMRNQMKNMHEACAEDRAKFCEGVQPGQGRMRDCYLKHQNELSQQCKDALPPGFLNRNPPPEVESGDPE